MCREQTLVSSYICTEAHRLVIKAGQMLLIIMANCEKEGHAIHMLYTSYSMIPTPWSVVVLPHTLIAIRVKYSRDDVKHHKNNDLFCLKIKK